MKKFTAGEWKRSQVSSIVGALISVEIDGASLNVAAAIPQALKSTTEANANLICAAPALYDAAMAETEAEISAAACKRCQVLRFEYCQKHQKAIGAAKVARLAALEKVDGA